MTSVTLGLIAVPDFLVAIFLILVLAVQASLVPAVSYMSGSEDIWKIALHPGTADRDAGGRRLGPDDPHDAGRAS